MLKPMSCKFPIVCSRRHFMGLPFIFRLMAQLLLKFVHVKHVSKFLFFIRTSNCFRTICWKNYLLSNKLKRKQSLCIYITNQFTYFYGSTSWIAVLFHWSLWTGLLFLRTSDGACYVKGYDVSILLLAFRLVNWTIVILNGTEDK